MKDKIYTIPVTDAFSHDCECPLCALEKKLEEETVDYLLGCALMEADCRQETNEHGFCRKHFESLYNSKLNTLGLGLILTTHLAQLNEKLQKSYSELAMGSKDTSVFKSMFSGKNTEEKNGSLTGLLREIDHQQSDCTICLRLSKTLKRYFGVMFHLWKTESDFRDIFNKKKGFCMRHFEMLIKESEETLNSKQRSEFLDVLIPQQLENLKRLQDEVSWFTQMFDYKNCGKGWGQSKDSVTRAIEKLVSYCKLD